MTAIIKNAAKVVSGAVAASVLAGGVAIIVGAAITLVGGSEAAVIVGLVLSFGLTFSAVLTGKD